MKDDTISRQAAIKAILKVPDGNWSQKRYAQEVKKVPSVDIQERLDNAYAHGYTAAESEYRAILEAAQPEQRWIPCSQRLPTKPGRYLATTEDLGSKSKVETALFDGDDFWENVRAWMPLPEPYKGEP